jgi:two-component system cell cycle sensor histidine kinase/response regulator CckA
MTNGTRMNILIVDDDSGDVYILRELLTDAEPEAARLVHVETLTTALERVQEEQFDVILLDFFLPGSQGVESLCRLREHAPDVPIVFLTGLNDDDLGRQMLEGGAQAYLVKGQIEGTELLRTLHDIIAQHRAQRSG